MRRLRSLTIKIALVVLVVSLSGVAMVALFSGWITMRQFDRLLLEQLEMEFIDRVTVHYTQVGSWERVRSAVDQGNTRFPPPLNGAARGRPPLGPEGRRSTGTGLFALLDQQGCVVVPAGPYRGGECLTSIRRVRSTPVELDGEVIGTVLTTGALPTLGPQEEAFLQRINQGFLWAGLGAGLLALILGSVLARTVTRPLHRLTTAIHAMAAGNLEQRVEVHSQDEMGELADAFNRMSAELSRANRLRRQMTADIAHDLRNPLLVMSGYLEALRDGVLRPTPERFEMMYAEAQHLQHLVADLRTLSMADAGELSLQRQSVAPADLLERVANRYAHAAEQKQIRLTAEAEAGLPPVVIDPERMLQVLGNLVGNALRHTPSGGTIEISATHNTSGVVLAVQDSGSGIAPEALPHIFERFYRVDTSRSGETGESGLGLAIARSIVTAHQGTINVESQLGHGSRFSIHLPVIGQV